MVVHLGICGGTIEKKMSLKLIQVNQGQKNVCGGTFWCQWSVVVHLSVCGGAFECLWWCIWVSVVVHLTKV